MSAIAATLEKRTIPYSGEIHNTYYVELASGDTMEPFLIPVGATSIVARVRPLSAGVGKVSQSWQQTSVLPENLILTDWDIGDTAASYVDSLILSNWITASCSSGAVAVEIMVVG